MPAILQAMRTVGGAPLSPSLRRLIAEREIAPDGTHADLCARPRFYLEGATAAISMASSITFAAIKCVGDGSAERGTSSLEEHIGKAQLRLQA